MDLSQVKLEIDELVVKKTNHCTHRFECLKVENYFLDAKVEKCLDGEILFVSCGNRRCNYRMDFGKSTICYCPTRKEIFRKYKK